MKGKDAVFEKTFFIVKYWLIGNIQNLVILSIVYFFGPIDLLKAILTGIVTTFTFIFLTRFFGRRINRLTLLISKKVNGSPKLRRIVVKYM